MARLNTHLSATPQPRPDRSSTVDSLYRAPTPRSHFRASTARDSSYSVMSPAQSATSDKENEEFHSRETTPRPPTKGLRHRSMAAPRLPTPTSGSSSTSTGHASKRRRTGDYRASGSAQIYVDDDAEEEDEQENDDEADEDEDEDEVVDGDAPADHGNEDDDQDESTKYYDPQQDPELRRKIRIAIRNNHRKLEDNRDDLVKPDNFFLAEIVRDQDRFMSKVKQTADAGLDARVIVYASELAGKRLDNSLYGNTDVGIDVDQFVSKCIFFMKSGGNTSEGNTGSSTQVRNRRQTATQAEDDEDDDTGDGLDWGVLGREACFPCNKRPAISSFLLGPLSVQKRARAVQSRRGKSQRQPTGPATRPQELTQADLQQSENSNLTHVVKGIRTRLEHHLTTATDKVENEIDDSTTEEDVTAALRQQRLYQTPEGESSVSLFDFVVNPKSFGQTVENIFYVSFLIKEGNLKVLHADDGLPLLVPCQPYTIEEQREQSIQKHQAIFSLDYPTWMKLIEAFDIQESLIPNRVEEESNVTSGGWYT